MLPSLSTSMGIGHADECHGTSVPRACTLNFPGQIDASKRGSILYVNLTGNEV